MGTKNNFVDIDGNIIEDILCVETDSHGLMCPEDKVKLDGIEEGANKTVALTDEEIEAICTFEGDPNNLIPIATHSSIGSVAVGDGLDIDNEGNLSVISLTDQEIEAICEFDEGMTEDNIIPKATRHAFGCVKVGNGLAIDANGRLYVTGDIVVVGGTGSGIGGSVPIGTILEFGGTEPPENWLLLNGQEVDRVAYAELFQLYGTAYGEGDGSTTFNLPDFRGKVPIGLDERDEDFNTLGNTGGEKTHKLTVAEMPSHSHGLTVRGSATSTSWIIDFQNVTGQSTSTGSTGGSQAHNNLQPYIVINYIVKAKAEVADLTLTEEKDVMELLWTNPNTTAEFTAQTINLDLSEYDSVEIRFISSVSSTANEQAVIPVGYQGGLSAIARIGSGSAIMEMCHRTAIVSTTGIEISGAYHKGFTSSTVTQNLTNYIIPYAIYGIKNKINVTTAVVTDKGQHTDLLWENAATSSEFAAQTIALDLNGYDEVEIAYRPFNATTATKSEVCCVGKGTILDLVMSNNGFGAGSLTFGGFRSVNTSTTGVTFDTAYNYAGVDDRCCIPTAIYGIKHNAATTSTIMGDYVIEEGTSDIWTYRKWNSGHCEVEGFGSTTATFTTLVGTAGTYGVYEGAIISISLPDDLLVSVNGLPWVSARTSNGAWAENPAANTTSVSFYPVNIVKQTSAIEVFYSIRVTGRWK